MMDEGHAPRPQGFTGSVDVCFSCSLVERGGSGHKDPSVPLQGPVVNSEATEPRDGGRLRFRMKAPSSHFLLTSPSTF